LPETEPVLDWFLPSYLGVPTDTSVGNTYLLSDRDKEMSWDDILRILCEAMRISVEGSP